MMGQSQAAQQNFARERQMNQMAMAQDKMQSLNQQRSIMDYYKGLDSQRKQEFESVAAHSKELSEALNQAKFELSKQGATRQQDADTRAQQREDRIANQQEAESREKVYTKLAPSILGQYGVQGSVLDKQNNAYKVNTDSAALGALFRTTPQKPGEDSETYKARVAVPYIRQTLQSQYQQAKDPKEKAALFDKLLRLPPATGANAPTASLSDLADK